MLNIKKDEVIQAYIKLKSYAYYNRARVVLLDKILEFEDEKIDQKLENLHRELTNDDISYHMQQWIEQVSMVCEPKRVRASKKEENIISNVPMEQAVVQQINYSIDMPIVLHIFSIIWIIRYGKTIESNFGDSVYSNRLKEDLCIYKTSLFEPYYKGYKKWKQDALVRIEKSLDEKNNIVCLCLDIKDFFYSIDMNSAENGFSKLDEFMKLELSIDELSEYQEMTGYIKQFCEKYSENFVGDKIVLPIGFLPSGILANWYLRKFDEEILNTLSPVHYGRYVDDITIVVNKKDFNDKIIQNTLVDSKILKKISKDKKNSIGISNITYELSCHGNYNDLFIQDEKIKTIFFDHNYSRALLYNLEEDLAANSSLFKFLPEQEPFINTFYEQVFKVKSKDYTRKFRNIDDFELDKYKLSTSIASSIMINKHKVNTANTDKYMLSLQDEIRYIFSDIRAIENWQLWERVIFLLAQIKQFREIEIFVNKIAALIDNTIVKIEGDHTYKIKNRSIKIEHELKKYLKKNLIIALASSLSLVHKSYEEASIKYNYKFACIDEQILDEVIIQMESTNMLRHIYVQYPLLNYCRNVQGDMLDFDIHVKSLKIDDLKIKYSPRFIHLHEIQLHNSLNMNKKGIEKNIGIVLNDNKEEMFNKSKKLFSEYNKIKCAENDRLGINIELKELSMFNENWNNSSKLHVNIISDGSSPTESDRMKIGIVSMKIPDSQIEEDIKYGMPITFPHSEEVKAILNEAIRNQVNFIVFPEVSIPIQWLNFLADFSRRNNICIIGGVRHFIKGTKSSSVNNMLVTILPIEKKGYTSAIINLRLKNHYSPKEEELIKGYGLKVPRPNNNYYDLFHWRGMHFSCYNCFELTSIEERALFKSKVDTIFASVFNRDVAYFSDIVETTARDVHCYVVHVNTAQYGDSRICQPTAAENKDIVKVKGGENTALLVGTIDIKELRLFQAKEHNLQLVERTKYKYKPTPAGFNREEVKEKLGIYRSKR